MNIILLSFILSIALLFGASGARATAISYHQVMGTQNATSISIDGLASDIEIGYELQLAFPGKTLDEINRCTLITELDGGEGDNTVTARATTWGLHPQRHTTNGSVDKLVYQIGVYEDGVTKAVILVLTNGADGVYVQKFGWCNRSGLLVRMRFFKVASNGTVSFRTDSDKPDNSGTSGGYNAWGLRIHGVKVVQTSSLAFPGATLESLKDCAFIAGYRAGDGLDKPMTNNWAAFKTCWTNSNDKLEKIVMQFESSESKKTAIMQLVDGEGGVYASQPCHSYNGTANAQKFAIDAIGNVTKSNGSGGNSSGEGSYSVSEFFAISQCIPKYPAKTKVFSDPTKTLTLNDIKEGVFRGRLCGGYVNKKELLYAAEPNTPAYHKKIYEDDGGNVTNIIVEYQEKDGTYVKCAVVSFQNGEDGVYASTILAPNKNGGTLGEQLYTGQEWGSGTIADSYTAKGYGVCDLHVWLPIVVQEGETLYIEGSSYAPSVLNNGTIVKTGNGTLTIPFNNDSTGVMIVSNGTLKVASKSGENTYTPTYTVRVARGATFDVNGIRDVNISVELEEGAFFVNRGSTIDNYTSQTVSLALEGDATVTIGKSFGLLAPNGVPTFLDLGSNTLTINGTADTVGFWLRNTTITGDGTIAVEGGTLQCARADSTGANCTLNIGANGQLRIDGTKTLCVSNFYNGGTLYNGNIYGGTAYGTLLVNGTLTPGNAMTNITLAAGATIKATGTAQMVSGTFSASGTITVDASEIDAQTLKAAGETGIPVLTVPAAFNPSSVEWNVANSVVNGVRAKWRTDEGGTTKTLYIARSSGLVVIIR